MGISELESRKGSRQAVGLNTVVTLDYRVTDEEGNLVDGGEQPIVYLHGGYGNLFAKIEAALEGKAEGDRVEVRLEPADAFGKFDASWVLLEPREEFPEGLQAGMRLERHFGEEGQEPIQCTVLSITEEGVEVDYNHPLAGKALNWSCAVRNVRAATAAEIAGGASAA